MRRELRAQANQVQQKRLPSPLGRERQIGLATSAWQAL